MNTFGFPEYTTVYEGEGKGKVKKQEMSSGYDDRHCTRAMEHDRIHGVYNLGNLEWLLTSLRFV